MLDIESVNHIGIRIKNKTQSIAFYQLLGFKFTSDAYFEQGHPIIMKHPSGVVINLLGPANMPGENNILMDVTEKYTGITHFALTVKSLDTAKDFMNKNGVAITGSFSFGNMSAIFVRDPDRNVIELDTYVENVAQHTNDYSNHL